MEKNVKSLNHGIFIQNDHHWQDKQHRQLLHQDQHHPAAGQGRPTNLPNKKLEVERGS
jgi:hypothetical protein